MEPGYKYITVSRKKTLADGTEKIYHERQRYKVKGYLKKDGTRAPKTEFTPEQIEDMCKRYADGVTIKRLQEDYNATYEAIHKLVKK